MFGVVLDAEMLARRLVRPLGMLLFMLMRARLIFHVCEVRVWIQQRNYGRANNALVPNPSYNYLIYVQRALEAFAHGNQILSLE